MPGVTTHRPGGTRYVAYGSALALVVMSVAVTVALPQEIRAQVTLSQALTLYGSIAAFIVVLHGIGRSYVRVDDDGLEVLNGFRRHRYAWSEVKGFAFDPGAPWPVLVRRADDERVMLFALQATGGHKAVRGVVEDLARRVP